MQEETIAQSTPPGNQGSAGIERMAAHPTWPELAELGAWARAGVPAADRPGD